MNMSKQQQKAGDNSSQFQADTIIQNFYSSPNKFDNTQIMNKEEAIHERNVILTCEQVELFGMTRLKVHNDGNLTARNVDIQILDYSQVFVMDSILGPMITTTICTLAPNEDHYYPLYILADFPQAIRIKLVWDDEHKLNNEKIITVKAWKPYHQK